MLFNWGKPLTVDWSACRGPIIEQHHIDNSVIKQLLRNEFYGPLHNREVILTKPFWDPKNPSKHESHLWNFTPGLKQRPKYPKKSSLTKNQHNLGMKLLSNEYDYVQPRQHFSPTEMDIKLFQEIKELYEKEQLEYKKWAKQCWINGDCLRVLRSKPLLEKVYDAQYKVKANELHSLPHNYTMGAQIPLITQMDTFDFHQKQDLIDVDLQKLPQVNYPKIMTENLCILQPCPMPEPCALHTCRFILPHEDTVSILPVGAVDRELANYAVDNDAQFVASENALQCLLDTDRSWNLPVSVIEVICADGDTKNIVVFGSEFSAQKECAAQRTYKAYKHLLRHRFTRASEEENYNNHPTKPGTSTRELFRSEHDKKLLENELLASSDEEEPLLIDIVNNKPDNTEEIEKSYTPNCLEDNSEEILGRNSVNSNGSRVLDNAENNELEEITTPAKSSVINNAENETELVTLDDLVEKDSSHYLLEEMNTFAENSEIISAENKTELMTLNNLVRQDCTHHHLGEINTPAENSNDNNTENETGLNTLDDLVKQDSSKNLKTMLNKTNHDLMFNSKQLSMNDPCVRNKKSVQQNTIENNAVKHAKPPSNTSKIIDKIQDKPKKIQKHNILPIKRNFFTACRQRKLTSYNETDNLNAKDKSPIVDKIDMKVSQNGIFESRTNSIKKSPEKPCSISVEQTNIESKTNPIITKTPIKPCSISVEQMNIKPFATNLYLDTKDSIVLKNKTTLKSPVQPCSVAIEQFKLEPFLNKQNTNNKEIYPANIGSDLEITEKRISRKRQCKLKSIKLNSDKKTYIKDLFGDWSDEDDEIIMNFKNISPKPKKEDIANSSKNKRKHNLTNEDKREHHDGHPLPKKQFTDPSEVNSKVSKADCISKQKKSPQVTSKYVNLRRSGRHSKQLSEDKGSTQIISEKKPNERTRRAKTDNKQLGNSKERDGVSCYNLRSSNTALLDSEPSMNHSSSSNTEEAKEENILKRRYLRPNYINSYVKQLNVIIEPEGLAEHVKRLENHSKLYWSGDNTSPVIINKSKQHELSTKTINLRSQTKKQSDQSKTDLSDKIETEVGKMQCNNTGIEHKTDKYNVYHLTPANQSNTYSDSEDYDSDPGLVINIFHFTAEDVSDDSDNEDSSQPGTTNYENNTTNYENITTDYENRNSNYESSATNYENLVELADIQKTLSYYGSGENEGTKFAAGMYTELDDISIGLKDQLDSVTANGNIIVDNELSLDPSKLSVDAINDIIGVNSCAVSEDPINNILDFNTCSCKGTMFEVPSPRSYKKWEVKNSATKRSFDIIVHCSHKTRQGKNEVILEPIVEYQPELGATKQSEGRLRALALALMLRRSASLINVRIDYENGNVLVINKMNERKFVQRHGARRREVADRLHTALEHLRHLRTGHYVLHHDSCHGDHAMVYSTRGGADAHTISLRPDNVNMPDAEEAILAKVPPDLGPDLLPYHKKLRILPLAFTSNDSHVKEDKVGLAKAKLPPQAIQWPKKKKKKKNRPNTNRQTEALPRN